MSATKDGQVKLGGLGPGWRNGTMRRVQIGLHAPRGGTYPVNASVHVNSRQASVPLAADRLPSEKITRSGVGSLKA